MTLDEAIKHCEEVAETNERICDTEPSIGLPDIYMHKDVAKKCASEHRQLAEWLKELKAYKEQGGDAISRQAVLDIINFEDKWLLDAKGHNADTGIAFSGMKSRIADLPSVTLHPCEDAISRKDAILQIQRHGVGCFDAEDFTPEQCERFVINKIKELPSVTPQQRKTQMIDESNFDVNQYEMDLQSAYDCGRASTQQRTGQWILLDECLNSGYYCSECQKKVVKEGWSNTVKKIKYCPNCGAKMEVEE